MFQDADWNWWALSQCPVWQAQATFLWTLGETPWTVQLHHPCETPAHNKNVFSTIATSDVTSRHQGPKRKLWAGYRGPSLKWTSHAQALSLQRTSHVAITFHCRVWYRALSLCMHALCAYSTFWHHPHPLGYPFAKFRFCHALHCWASLYRKIAYSITLSLHLFDSPGTEVNFTNLKFWYKCSHHQQINFF